VTRHDPDARSPDTQPLTHDEVRRLLEAAQSGDNDAREQLVNANLRLVWHVVNRFRGAPIEQEELFQVGCVGLLKAIDQFDLSYEVRFSTYAVPVMLGEIRRQLRDFGPIKVSRSQKRLASAVQDVRRALTQQIGREPTLEEIADELGVERMDVVEALESNRPPLSLFEHLGSGSEDNAQVIDRIVDDDEEWFDSLVIRDILSRLEPRERRIIILRFFHEKTQAEVGADVGLSQVQVSRIERKVLDLLRERLTS